MAEQRGPLMARFKMDDGTEMILPADAKFYPRLRPDLPLCPLCIGEGSGGYLAKDLWICGECGGSGQVEN